MPQARIKPDGSVSKTVLDTAGNRLSGRPTRHFMGRDEVLSVISKWRSAHGYPLNAFAVTLRTRARKIDPDAIIAQRLKRLSSIEAKLQRFQNMELSTMQDIGGCRAVVRAVEQVEELARVYRDADAKNPHRGPKFVKIYDYLSTPKMDGYRGIHLVYRYRTLSPHNVEWNGLRIELQLRSRLQHAWSTAVETVSTFTGQQLKSNIGENAWKRFFALMGTVVAIKENRPAVPNTPASWAELVSEIQHLDAVLRIDSVLSGWQYAVDVLGEQEYGNAVVFLLALDSQKQQITIKSYRDGEQEQASAEYLEIEKEAEGNPYLNAVLASAESIAALKAAFPNYYLDTTAFREVVSEVLGILAL